MFTKFYIKKILLIAFVIFAGFGFSTKAESATNIYYSVGQNTTDHKTGSPTVTIADGVATFSVAQTATNMGVGDIINYGGQRAFISGKQSTSIWNVITATGTQPVATTSATVSSITHAFASLNAAVGGASPGAAGASFLATTSLIAAPNGGDYILNIPSYYDTEADTTRITISGWTTGSGNYINIYTPTDTSIETNQSQRHSGVWDDTKYRLEITPTGAGQRAIVVYAQNIRITGLQIKMTSTYTTSDVILTGATSWTDPNANDVRYSDLLVKAVFSGAGSGYGISCLSDSDARCKVYNNIVYGVTSNIAIAGYGYYYNNTVYNSATCFSGNGSAIAKNNIAQSCSTDGYAGSFSATLSTNNLSYLAGDAPGVNPKNSATVTFVNTTTGSEDLHLSSLDTAAKDQGIDLSSDPDGHISFTTDIDSEVRSGTWDIGADEYIQLSSGPVRSNGSPSGNINYNTTSTTISLQTDVAATCKYSSSEGAVYDSMTNTFSTTGGTTHSISVSGLSSGGSYTYYVKCYSDSANTDDFAISFTVGSMRYVRADASGSNNGLDWTNAYTALPSVLNRGDIYYIADGDYAAYTIDDTNSGTVGIAIKKATSSDHGTNTGWSSAYGDGQAVFPNITISVGYITLDGAAGSLSSNPASYGIKLTPTNCSQVNRLINIDTTSSNNVIKHVALVNCGSSYDFEQTGIRHSPVSSALSSNQMFIDNYFSGSNTNLIIRFCTDCVARRNYFHDNWSSSNNHGGQIVPADSSNTQISENIFENTSVYLVGPHVTACSQNDTGTITDLTNNILTDNTKNWTPDAYIGKQVGVTHNTLTLYFIIIDNDATTLTVAPTSLTTEGAIADTYTIKSCINPTTDLKFYNNIIIGDGVSSYAGVINADSAYVDVHIRTRVFNNTFYNVNFSSNGATSGTRYSDISYYPVAQNNLFYNCINTDYGRGFANDYFYNAYLSSPGSYGSESGIQQDDTATDPFVNVATNDFRLVSGALAYENGTDLSALATLDFNGVSRPQGVAWDIGAYEYVESPDATPPTPGSLTFSSVTQTSITASSIGASDAVALAVLPYQYHNITSGTYSGVTSSPWIVNGLTANTSYTFEVGVQDLAGNWATSTTYSTTTLAIIPVSTPTVTTVSANGPIVGANIILPGQVKPRQQTIYPDGRIVYQDEPNSTSTPTQTQTTNTVSPTTTTYTFTRDLSLHSRGLDVKALQQYLNAKGFTVAKTGPGSPGNETTLFGTLTYRALVKFQKSAGLPATGYFGKMTRGRIVTSD